MENPETPERSVRLKAEENVLTVFSSRVGGAIARPKACQQGKSRIFKSYRVSLSVRDSKLCDLRS
jgi:hypothetical protein